MKSPRGVDLLVVDFVDEGGQLDIAGGKTLNVVCCQSDLNTVVDLMEFCPRRAKGGVV